MTTAKQDPGLHITDQFRTRRGMVYDLKREGARVSLCIGQAEEDAGGAWSVEAKVGKPSEVVITESGPTPIDALREVGRTWARQATELALPPFDWDEIVKALTAVRAL